MARTNLSKINLVFLWVLCMTNLSAQQYVDLAELYYANTPINQFDSTTNGTRIEELGMDVTLPFQFENGNAIITGWHAESITAKIDPTQNNLTSVYSVLLKLGFQTNHGSKWVGTYALLPKLSSDFIAIGPEDFQLGAYTMLKYKKRKNLNYQFGMYYNQELFGPLFVPLFGMYYLSPNKKFEANIILPFHIDFDYALKPWLKAGANFTAFIRTYHLNEPYNGNTDNYLAKASNEVFGYLQWEIANHWVIQTKIGYSFGRNYRIYDEKDQVVWGLSAFRFGDNRQQLNSDFEDGVIYKLRLLYRFHIEDE